MGKEDLVGLWIYLFLQKGEGQVQGVVAVFLFPEFVPLVGGVGDFVEWFIGVFVPKAGELGEVFGFPIMIGHLLLGDEAQPVAKTASAAVVVKFFDVLGNLEERFLHDILAVGGRQTRLEGDAVDELAVEVVEFRPTAGVGIGLAQSFNQGLSSARRIHAVIGNRIRRFGEPWVNLGIKKGARKKTRTSEGAEITRQIRVVTLNINKGVKTTGCLLFTFLFLSSCTDQPFYEKVYPFINRQWSQEVKPEFQVEITDIKQEYDFTLSLRATTGYAYNNLWVFMKTETPDGTTVREPFEIIVANPDGSWVGNKTGTIIETPLYFKSRKLPQKGIYKFTIEQGITESKINEVLDLGFRVEKTKKD